MYDQDTKCGIAVQERTAEQLERALAQLAEQLNLIHSHAYRITAQYLGSDNRAEDKNKPCPSPSGFLPTALYTVQGLRDRAGEIIRELEKL